MVTHEERSAAIEERRAELMQVQRDMKDTEKRYDKLEQRVRMLNHEIDALLVAHNDEETTRAFDAQ